MLLLLLSLSNSYVGEVVIDRWYVPCNKYPILPGEMLLLFFPFLIC